MYKKYIFACVLAIHSINIYGALRTHINTMNPQQKLEHALSPKNEYLMQRMQYFLQAISDGADLDDAISALRSAGMAEVSLDIPGFLGNLLENYNTEVEHSPVPMNHSAIVPNAFDKILPRMTQEQKNHCLYICCMHTSNQGVQDLELGLALAKTLLKHGAQYTVPVTADGKNCVQYALENGLINVFNLFVKDYHTKKQCLQFNFTMYQAFLCEHSIKNLFTIEEIA